MTHRKVDERTWSQRLYYMISGIFLGLFPLMVGNMAADIVEGSNMWWDVSVYFYYGLIGYFVIIGAAGLHRVRFFAVMPVILMSNLTLFFSMVILWRLVDEEVIFGYLLAFTQLLSVVFAYIYSRECLKRNFKAVNDLGRTLMKIVLLLPLAWIWYMGDYFHLDFYVIAVMFYFLNIGSVAMSIQFRDPSWMGRTKESIQ